MTATLDPVDEAELASRAAAAAADALDEADANPPEVLDDAPVVEEPLGPVLRPLIVAALTSGAAGLMTGGIFGSWTARLLALFAAVFGVFWSWVCLRSKRRVVFQAALLPVAFVLGILSLVPTPDGPAKMFTLIGEAISSGRLLRPPVPFDPGWRPVLLLLLSLVGFAAGWVATAMQRPQIALLLPLPILGLTAISQPAEGEFIAGVLGFLPLLLALALLFGGDTRQVSELSSAFELKRAARGAPLLLVGLVVLVLLSQTDFLFPKPVYNPAQKPQKPKAVPLGEVRDRVLFEIDGPITGPWKTGVLDFYDGKNWRLPPFDPSTLKKIPGDGVVDKTRVGDVTVNFIVRDLGTSAVLPAVAGPTKIEVDNPEVIYDPRAGIFRIRQGRVPADLPYKVSLPSYPKAEQLRAAGPPTTKIDPDLTYVPKPTPVVARLLAEAPENRWDRMNYLRKKLNEVVIAAGAGAPNAPVPPSKVDDLLEGSHEGTPFQIVAAEALLARWAGVPARVAYGFDGFNDEDGKKTIRPKNGSNWLEVYFEGYGWVPIIGAPPKAKTSLDTDPNAKFDPNIVPSDDVAVELYIPIELENLQQLYQQVRAFLLQALPFVLGSLAVYLALPAARRTLRRRKRRRWAASQGFREEIAVEYCELRDALFDLNVGDPSDTPLEYLQKVTDDDEHAELAWLVTRATYGDLAFAVTDDDVESARAMATSVRRRVFRAQPFQSRALAVLSRASLRQPYTVEVPTVRQFRLRRSRPAGASRRRLSRRVRLTRAVQRTVSRGRK